MKNIIMNEKNAYYFYLIFGIWYFNFGILAFLPYSTLLNINVSEEVTTAAHFV